MTAGDAPVIAAPLREAARWRLLGRLLECPDDAWRRDIASLASEVDDPLLREAAAAAVASADQGVYHSVFGPGGPAPPREASHYQSVELGSLMSHLAACYSAFGYQPAGGEAPDHVATEAGFIAYLYLKEAYALTCGDSDRARETAEFGRRFCSEHLAVVAHALAALVAGSGIEYLEQTLAVLSALAGPAPQPTRLPMLSDSDDDSDARCCDT